MAKSHSKTGGTGPARIRLVVLEADLPDGDIGSLTQAVQNALRPPEVAPVVRRVITAPTGNKADAVDADAVDDLQEYDSAAPADAEISPNPRRTRSATKPRSPKVIELDLKAGEIPFSEFASKINPSSHPQKNLVAAAWLKEHRGIASVTMDHIYTCYREMGWQTGMEDFGLTLRQLKQRDLMSSPSRGQYAINHIGLNEVLKLNGS